MARLTVGYPEPDDELAMLDARDDSDPLDSLEPVTDAETLTGLIDIARRTYASPAVKRYVVDLVGATRSDPALRLGGSPRASIQLLRAARAMAALTGRDHVLPDDVQRLAVPVLAHRMLSSTAGHVAGRGPAEVVADLVARVPLPVTGAAARRAAR
jgi:MoxR-like ATPase